MELTHLFGRNKTLFGVTNNPDLVDSDSVPWFLFLNSGILPHHGPNRIYVSLARRLAKLGIPSFRFDFSGIGDSDMGSEIIPQGDWLVNETVAAMDLLQSEYGAQHFVVAGICSGADVSREVVASDSRICGIIQIDGFAHPSRGFYLQSYARQFMRMRSWKNFFSGGSDLWALVKGFVMQFFGASKSTKNTDHNMWRTLSPTEQKGRIKSAVNRGAKTLLLFSSGSPAYYNYQHFLEESLTQDLKKPEFEVKLIEGADHGFTLNCHQEKLFCAIEGWTEQVIRDQTIGNLQF